MSVSDAQLARALVSVARIFGESRSAVLVEVESAPVLDQAEVDAAIDRALAPDSAPGVAADEGSAEFAVGPDVAAAGPGDLRAGRFSGGLRRHASSGLSGVVGMAQKQVKATGVGEAMRARVDPVAGKVLRPVRGEFYPGHPEWLTLDVEQRAGWWADRLGTLMAVVAAAPALSGRGAKVVKATPLLGCAAQAVAICAAAREFGVTDEVQLVQTLAKVIFKRDLDAVTVQRAAGSAPPMELSADGQGGRGLSHVAVLGSAAKATRQASVLRSTMGTLKDVSDLLDARSQGGWFTRKMTNIPVAGAAAAFRSERAGLREALGESVKIFQRTSHA